MPHRHVERFRRDVFLGPVGDRAFEPAAIGSTIDGMEEFCFGGACQRVGERRACSGVMSRRKTLTATRRSRVGLVGRNTGPSAPTPI